jgi:zinc transport system ATP-binding protein
VTDGQELVRVDGISFYYDSSPVLEDINFTIGRGDFLALLGPNGSGKTTLVKIVLGLLKPTRGRVLLMGKPVEEFRDWSRVGYVPQKATHIDPLFPASVREVVSMALFSGKKKKISGSGGKAEVPAIGAALKKVGMEGFMTRPIGSLSGGQQQRVVIARAIVNAPDLLFLDEPTTGVDAATQGLFYEMLHRLNADQKITIVLVTHDIGIVNRHISRVACLNQKLVYHGTHEDFCRSEAFKAMLASGHLVSHNH